MQLPSDWHLWGATILQFWQRYRPFCIAGFGIVLAVLSWFIPVSHNWLITEAVNSGIGLSQTDNISNTPSPTVNTLDTIQKKVETLSTQQNDEAKSRQTYETQLQDILTQLGQLISGLNQSIAQLNQ